MNDREIIDGFHNLWYRSLPSGYLNRHTANTKWCGVPIVKWPCDLFLLQEVIWETEPNLIVETGTHKGASAMFMADMIQAFCGRVVTIDIEAVHIEHDDVLALRGNSVDPHTRFALEPWLEDSRVMVVLDSDHTARHVYAEMELYGPLVTPGCYMVVEDTNLGGNPIEIPHAPPGDEYDHKGPTEAVRKFQEEHPGMFEVDHAKAEKFLFSMNTWLKRL